MQVGWIEAGRQRIELHSGVIMAFQRAIFYKFKDTATEEEIERHFESFAALEAKIDVIFSYCGGRTVPSPEKDGMEPQYDAFHYATFATAEDIVTYNKHKAYQAFVAENKGIWEDVFVLNARIEKPLS
jgi:hypothetical protein